jgi:UDP-3-O-[3-hydroxymyristoyl] glucosamine N-acyltransferase
MSRTVNEIAKHIHGKVFGNGDIEIKSLSGIKEAQPGDITFVANSKYFPLVEKTKASAIICPEHFTAEGHTLIQTGNPSLSFAKVVPLFMEEPPPPARGIHPTAIIGPDVVLGNDVSVGPYTVIEREAHIGARTVIGSQCFIGYRASVGQDSLIYPNVSIRERVAIGSRVIVHCGTVIGSDGFGFVNIEGRHEKIPQVGTVEVCDDVEIGANVTIDRARFDKTVIGAGTKIDNLVQIAHNVRIGEHCLIVAQVGISGSDIIEDRVVLAGQAGLAGHLTVGEGAIVAAQAGVVSSIPPHTMVSGYPAKPHQTAKRINAHIQRLPVYVKKLSELQKQIDALQTQMSQLFHELKNNEERA